MGRNGELVEAYDEQGNEVGQASYIVDYITHILYPHGSTTCPFAIASGHKAPGLFPFGR